MSGPPWLGYQPVFGKFGNYDITQGIVMGYFTQGRSRFFSLSLWIVVAFFIGHSLYGQHQQELVLLHTNDMHAHLLGVRANDMMCSVKDMATKDCFGGFDRIAYEVARQKEMHKNALLLDAGDQFQGSLFHTLYKGSASASIMNQIGFDAMTLGNHEFDDGPKALKSFADLIRFPMVSANIDVSKSPELKNKIRPYIIIKRGGHRVGVVGYTTEDTAYLSSPGVHVKFLPIIESVKKAVMELKKAGVDVIVAISHSGLNKDIEVAKNVSGIAAIVCGHSNSLLSNLAQNADGPSPMVISSPTKKPVLLVSAYAYGKYLGKLRFSFDATGVPTSWEGEPILLDDKIPRHDGINKKMMELYAPIEVVEMQNIGVAPVDLEGQSCRFEECVFGNLIADAMFDYGRPFGVRIALMNAGGIRASIPKGPMNRAQLQDVLPFDKTLVFFKLKGSLIRQIIEHGVTYVDDMKNDNTGRFLQVAGLKYTFNSTRPKGRRISDIVIVDPATKQMEPLSMTKVYVVVTNSYLANGGDNYAHFAKADERWSVGIELKDLLANFLAISLSKLPKREGRIVNLAPAKTPTLQANISN